MQGVKVYDARLAAIMSVYAVGSVLTFNSVGPLLQNIWPFFLSEANAFTIPFLWGSFDGSTNEPVVYPIGTSIQQIEAQVLGSQ